MHTACSVDAVQAICSIVSLHGMEVSAAWNSHMSCLRECQR